MSQSQSNDVKTNGNPQEENNNNNNNVNEATATTASTAALHSQQSGTSGLLSPSMMGGGLYGGYGSTYGLSATGGMYGSGYGGYGGGMMMSDPTTSMMMFGGGGASGLGHPEFGIFIRTNDTEKIVSMNSQALKHMFVSSKQMIQQSITTFGEMRQQFETFVLEYDLSSMLQSEEKESQQALFETKEELIKKRKLKAIRWTMAFALSILGYKIAKYIVRRMFQNHQQHQRAIVGEYPYNSQSHSYFNAGGGDPYSYLSYNNQHQQGYYYNTPSPSQQYYGQNRWF